MNRTAACVCGQLKVTMEGDPFRVVICNCTYCQKRSGSPFGQSAYFETSQVVAIEGEHKAYKRASQRNRWFEHHFCPECGSAVFWYGEFRPDAIGIAAGSFTDPDFPEPVAVVWAGTRYKWVSFPEGIEILEEQSV